MAGRHRLLLLIPARLAALGALLGIGAPALAAEDEALVRPEVERREIRSADIDTENFEITVFGGGLAIQDFGFSGLYGARVGYHVIEDLFVEATYGMAEGGETSFEELSGSAQLLTDDERQFRYYDLRLGWNVFPGEAFFWNRRALASAFYLTAGVGGTEFGGDTRFTVSFGGGYRVLLNDWLSLRFEAQDHVFESEILGERETVHNLELSASLSAFF
ncbi:MAG: outer membrane beta-barrel domain-containing protein [Pseudomonadales bacterium]|jgi:outer membrane beta-barrel protein|nr:outer membrane beta-barrel domain-containing protein [Pseudomonadales bacterium]